MPNPLIPSISSNQVSASAMLANPARLNGAIARLAADRLVLDAFFSPIPGNLTGGGLLYSVLKAGSNYSVRDVEQRTPGAEYGITYSSPDFDLANPQDWGAKVRVLDEERDRNDLISLGNKLTTLANTLVRKIDSIAVAAIEAALTKWSIASVPGTNWGTLITVGDPTTLTSSANRPTAQFANANLLAAVDDIGVGVLNTLVVHPQQRAALQIAYGTDLNDVLASAGITAMRASLSVTNGTAYLVESGKPGRVAFERPLTTELIPDRHTRSQWVQTYAVPAFAVSTPGAVRKITGLAG